MEKKGRNMKEYGGYIQLEEFAGEEYYTEAIKLNCGRNCVRYLFETKKIRKLYIPYFMCDSLRKVCIEDHIEYEFYHIDARFRPKFEGEILENDWLYIVNFYGQLSTDEMMNYKKKWKNIIIDNAQAFFVKPMMSIDTIYICRKFFGVPDGAYLFTDIESEIDYPYDISYDRVHFLMGRYEGEASEFYGEYVKNNMIFDSEPIKRMSRLTRNLLKPIDYEETRRRRDNNFCYVDHKLRNINKLQLSSHNGPFAYPLLIENGREIRKNLISKKIYIPVLWPDVFEYCAPDTLEYQYAENILPIPVDQRYGKDDMKYICEAILQCI